MKLGYGKGKNPSLDGYHVIKNVVGVDIEVESGYKISIREHGLRISKGQEDLLHKNWPEL